MESGTLLCQAYEAYLELHVPVNISFEHAWFLLLALARRDEVGVARCEDCGGDCAIRWPEIDRPAAIVIGGSPPALTHWRLSAVPN